MSSLYRPGQLFLVTVLCLAGLSNQLLARNATEITESSVVCRGRFHCAGEPAVPGRTTDVGTFPISEECSGRNAMSWVSGFAAGVCSDKGGVDGGVEISCTTERAGRPTNWDTEF